MSRPPTALLQTRSTLRQLVDEAGLFSTPALVLARPLTPEEAIGTPGRRGFPISAGNERVIEAVVHGAKGQAFTDSPREFVGTVGEALELELTSNGSRAIYLATLNAILAYLGRVSGTVHCKDDDPEVCAAEIASRLRREHGSPRVGLVGLNPAIAERLVDEFGADQVRITDLCPAQVGQVRFGVEVWDGSTRVEDLISESDVVLMTGTTLQNDTFDQIWASTQRQGKRGIVFGITASGVCALAGYPRLCPRARAA